MPILDLQQRARELGRIRMGQVQISAKGKTYPEKIDKFRLTSASRPLLEKVAALYGGEVRAWTPANGGPEQWEVFTATDRLPILVPPQPVTQWYELWSGGGCQRRCDGQREIRSESPCLCAQADERLCKPTTRLNVVLRDVEGIGVFRLETHGYYAATELPNMAAFLEQAGGYVEAWLILEQRTVKREGEKPKHFMVPAIEIEGVTPGQLVSGQVIRPAVGSGQAPAAVEGARPAIAAAAERVEAAPLRDFVAEIKEAKTRDDVVVLWNIAKRVGVPNGPDVEAAAKERVAELEQQAKPAEPTGAEAHIAAAKTAQNMDDLLNALNAAVADGFAKDPQDQSDPMAQAFVERRRELEAPQEDRPAATAAPDPEALWSQIVSEAGSRGFDRTDDVEQAFARRWQGDAPGAASPTQLQTFLDELRDGKVRPPQAATVAASSSEERPPF